MATNPYKKKLATASINEAKAMDNAYSTALKKGVSTYTHDGLAYAVQPDKARVYATDIVSARTPKPITPTPTKPTAPKPKVAIPDTTRTDKPVVKSTAPPVQPVVEKEEPSEKLSPTTMGGASSTNRNYSSMVKKVEPIKQIIAKPSNATAIESTKVAPQTYGKKKQTATMNYADLTGGLVKAGIETVSKHYEPAVNTIKETTALGVNGIKREYAKKFGDDSDAISKFPSAPVTQTKPITLPKRGAVIPDSTDAEKKEAARLKEVARGPAIITGDTINDNNDYYHLPEVIDLTRIKAGVRNRGDRTPVQSDAVIATAFDNSRIITKKDPSFNSTHNYVGIDKEGNMKAGYGSDFGDDAQIIPFPIHYGVEAFSKKPDGDYNYSKKDVGDKGFTAPMIYGKNGMEPLNLMVHRGNKQDLDTYGNVTGGRIIITSPDMKKQILVSGSVKHIEAQLEKFKKDNGLSKVNLVKLDNGSYSRGFRTKDRHIDENDWREFDNRNTGGGSGFYLQGDGSKQKLAMGGMIKKKLANGGIPDPRYANYGAGLQVGAQAINMVDGMDGRPSTMGGIASGAMSGASMGAALGVPGMAVGALVGGGAALIASERAKKAEAEANDLHMQNLTDMNKVTSKNTLRNYATTGVTSTGHYAYGGDIEGYNKWRASLPPNLQNEDGTYDLRGAYEAGLQPELMEDGTYHMGSRNPQTGRILKSPAHPTFKKAMEIDKAMGYIPIVKPDGKVYTQNPSEYAYGGQPTQSYEVEGNEVVQGQGVQLAGQEQLASDVHRAVGPSHEEGGVDGTGGERVFSDRLKPVRGGKTYAQIADKLGKKKGKFEDKMSSHNTAAKNTGKRMIERIDNELDKTFNEQEMMKAKKFATNQAPLSSSSSKPKMWSGGDIDPKLGYNPAAAGSSMNPLPGGWKFDPRSKRPMNYVNHNGMYGQASDAFANGEFLMPGQMDSTKDFYNTYPNPVMANKRGTMYNTSVDAFIKPKIGTNSIDGLPIDDLPIDPNKYARPNMTVTPTTSTATDGTGVKGKKLAGDLLPWQFVDNLANGIATANTPKIPKPYLDDNVKLNTTFDINPQLSSARNTKDALVKSINANTAQSGVSNSNKQQLFATYNDTANGLYGQKFNVENELKNKEIMINQGINSDNKDKLFNHDVANAARRGNIGREYANNASNFANDMYTSARDAKMDARDLENIKMLAMANPNSTDYGMKLQAFKDMYTNDPASLDAAIATMQKNTPDAPALKDLLLLRQTLKK